jgi:hypothetical protein
MTSGSGLSKFVPSLPKFSGLPTASKDVADGKCFKKQDNPINPNIPRALENQLIQAELAKWLGNKTDISNLTKVILQIAPLKKVPDQKLEEALKEANNAYNKVLKGNTPFKKILETIRGEHKLRDARVKLEDARRKKVIEGLMSQRVEVLREGLQLSNKLKCIKYLTVFWGLSHHFNMENVINNIVNLVQNSEGVKVRLGYFPHYHFGDGLGRNGLYTEMGLIFSGVKNDGQKESLERSLNENIRNGDSYYEVELVGAVDEDLTVKGEYKLVTRFKRPI